MKNYFKLLVIALALLIVLPSAQAQSNKYREKYSSKDRYPSNGRWIKIGTQTVQKLGDRDEFRPSDGNSFNALKIKVKKNTVSFNKMTIVYESGQHQDIELRQVMRDGQESRVINLIFRRRIDRIQFYYKTRNLVGSRAEVEIWARR